MKKYVSLLMGLMLIISQSKGVSFQQQEIQQICRVATEQYSYMWWINSIKEKNPLLFAVKTNRYAFVFDVDNLDFQNLLIKNDIRASEEILPLSTNELFNEKEFPKLSFGIETNGLFDPCRKSTGNVEDCQLIHNGRFLQQRFINNIPALVGCEPNRSGLDIVAWNDRLSLIVRIVPTTNFNSKSLVMQFELPSSYQEIQLKETNFKIFKNQKNGKGYIIAASNRGAQLFVSGNTVITSLVMSGQTSVFDEVQNGLIIYPVSDLDIQLNAILSQEENPLILTAHQIIPVDTPLEVGYDFQKGYHFICLRNDVTGKIEIDNDRMEKVLFTIENNSSFDKTIRLNFLKDGQVYGLPGISGIIRNIKGYPTGIPVQLSKNWHIVDYKGYGKHTYRGPWFHGITVLTIPAHRKIELEYIGLNAHWGGVPAASHAQLCLVGWGHNQQWNSSAIGAWGESICYEPDLHQASAPITDIRPLLVIDPQGRKWGWTGNVGGADFFNLYKVKGRERAWHTAMKTYYKRQCPNFTEVIYDGEMLNGNVKLRYTTSIGRSDDMTRGIYRIRMDVKKDISFEELDIFQMGAATYHYVTSKKIATGNEKGLVNEWLAAENGNKSNYINQKSLFQGRLPWIYFYDSRLMEDPTRFIAADRGFVIREWHACINGRDDIPPHWQEYYSAEGYHGAPTSIINVTLPEGCKTLLAGDYIETEIEIFIIPMNANDYYGPDTLFKHALTVLPTWQRAYREVIGNDITVSATKGFVEHQYPIVISAENDEAFFTVKGGIGYVPLTIKKVSRNNIPELYVKDKGVWGKIDQSTHGNDFWQTDFDPITKTWEFTYNVKLDSKENKKSIKEFKFIIVDF